ncbi:MAG: hypothetical protein DDT26_02297 [Dehalococcoidia bacterium]|nr:hypothetical protein [Chloroflexota bacterium]
MKKVVIGLILFVLIGVVLGLTACPAPPAQVERPTPEDPTSYKRGGLGQAPDTEITKTSM